MSSTTPRPSLHAARHEDSALFSVAEVLRAAPQAAARGRSDSSGFVDVRDLRAPSLGLAGLQSPQAGAPRRRRPSGLHGVVATLAVALLGSLTAVAAPFAAQAHDRDEAAEAAMYGTWEFDDAFDGDVLLIPDEDEDEDEAEAEAEAPETEAVEAAPAKAKATPRRASKSSSKAAKTPAKAPVPASPARPPVVDAGPDPMSVECLLSPAACKQPTSAAAKPAAKTPEPAAALPDKLGAAALKAGVGSARDAARSECARLAGGADKVEVRLSILGRSGEVVSAKAQGAAAGTAAGACVEEALSAARFDRFTAPQQGLVVTVRF